MGIESVRQSARLVGAAVSAALLFASWLAEARAQTPVIGPGREAEITALAAPFTLGGEITAGWTLQSIAIEPTTIRFVLQAAAGDETAALTLHHPNSGPNGARPLPSFVLTEEGGPESAAARAALARALEANDDGRFWERAVRVDAHSGERAPAAAGCLYRTSPVGPVAIAAGALVVGVLALFARRRPRRD